MAKNLDNQIDLLRSSNSDEWGTPNWLYDNLNAEFEFDLDVCASDENHKHENYFSINDDALNRSWNGNVFCNPPYSKTAKFLEKAHEELRLGNCKTAVFLIFANTETKYFHNYILGKAEIRFLKGRLKFFGRNKKGVLVNNSAMRPSIVCILRSSLYHGIQQIKTKRNKP